MTPTGYTPKVRPGSPRLPRPPKGGTGLVTAPAGFVVDETTLVFAFRYALGRTSTAPSHVAEILLAHWDRLAQWTMEQIAQEIRTAMRRGMAGHECDVQTWQRVLDRADGLCADCGRVVHICVCSHDS